MFLPSLFWFGFGTTLALCLGISLSSAWGLCVVPEMGPRWMCASLCPNCCAVSQPFVTHSCSRMLRELCISDKLMKLVPICPRQCLRLQKNVFAPLKLRLNLGLSFCFTPLCHAQVSGLIAFLLPPVGLIKRASDLQGKQWSGFHTLYVSLQPRKRSRKPHPV